MKKLVLICLVLLAPVFLYADEAVPAATGPTPADKAADELATLASRLGMSLTEVVETAGLPSEMYTLRGPSAGQDSVVFFYPSRVSLYWTESHVWQVRIDSEYKTEEGVLKMGMSRSELTSILGEADLAQQDFLIYTLPQRGYPVACALYFENDRLNDLYVYRSDF